MQNLKSAVRWLFGDPAGHFAIAVALLLICGAGMLLPLSWGLRPYAQSGMAALSVAVLTKLR